MLFSELLNISLSKLIIFWIKIFYTGSVSSVIIAIIIIL